MYDYFKVIQNLYLLQWESIAELNKLQNLEDLRFIRNPILGTETYATCNQIIVAMIANLKVSILGSRNLKFSLLERYF